MRVKGVPLREQLRRKTKRESMPHTKSFESLQLARRQTMA